MPRSRFAFFCLGILLSYIPDRFIQFVPLDENQILDGALMFAFLLLLIGVYTLIRKKIFRWFIIGLVAGIILVGYRAYQTHKSEMDIQNFLESAPDTNWEMQTVRNIRKDMILFHAVGWNPREKSLLIPIATKDANLSKHWICPRSAFYAKVIPRDHYLFPYVKRLGKHRIFLNTKKCKRVGEDLTHQKKAEIQLKNRLGNGNIEAPYKNIAMALVLGNTDFLPRKIYEHARDSGTLHLFAASGLHIGIFIGSLYLFGKHILRLGYYSSLVFPLGFAWVYLYMLSFPVSLTRAFFFAFAIVVSKLVFRKMSKMDLLVSSATVVYLFREDSFLSVGFYLSFLAVFGIFFLKPQLEIILYRLFNSPEDKEDIKTKQNLNPFMENLTLSLSANLATLPVVFLYFPGFSFGSLICNLILVPYTGILLPLLYLNLFLESILPAGWISFLWVWTDFGLRLLVLLTDGLSGTIGFYHDWKDSGNEVPVGIFILLILIILTYRRGLDRIRILSILTIFLAFSLFPLGYIWNRKELLPMKEGILHVSNDSYAFHEGGKLSIGGYCKNDEYKIRSTMKDVNCQDLNSIYLDHESCMQYVMICMEKNRNLTIRYGSRYMKGWANKLPDMNWKSVKKNSVFSSSDGSPMKQPVFFFKAGFDPKWLPKYINKKHKKGILVLQIPHFQKRKFAHTKWSRKTLGLGEGWEILRIDDE